MLTKFCSLDSLELSQQFGIICLNWKSISCCQCQGYWWQRGGNCFLQAKLLSSSSIRSCLSVFLSTLMNDLIYMHDVKCTLLNSGGCAQFIWATFKKVFEILTTNLTVDFSTDTMIPVESFQSKFEWYRHWQSEFGRVPFTSRQVHTSTIESIHMISEDWRSEQIF